MDLDAIAWNFRSIRSRVGPSRKILCVVKADAYGHGAVAVARRLEMEGADSFGVAMAEEGLELRRAGLQTPILVLGVFSPEQIAMMVEASLTPTVYSTHTLSAVLEAGRRLQRPIPFHLKIDTGMGRLGFPPTDLGPALDRIAALRTPALEGVLTTLSNGEEADSPITMVQMRVFSRALEEIRRRGLKPASVHVSNSGGILTAPAAWFDMVRPGLAIYGLRPVGGTGGDLRPALSLLTRIVLLKTVPPDTPIGYGGSFRTARESRIATIACGYGDGLNRLLHDNGWVLLRGRRAPFAGRISMDLATVDVTDVPDATEGDEVTIIGRQGDEVISAWDLARACRTIPYEILCRIGSRVPRIYTGEAAPRSIRSRFEF